MLIPYLFLALTVVAFGLSAYHAVLAGHASGQPKLSRSHRRRQIIWMAAATLSAAAYLRLQ